MKRPQAPVRMLHHLAVLDRLLSVSPPSRGAGSGAGSGHRRSLQRHRWLNDMLSDRLPMEPTGGDRFWVVLRWGGCGLLAAEALHHFLPG